LQQDVSLARGRTRANAAFVTGGDQTGHTIVLNGQIYGAQLPSSFSSAERYAHKTAYERVATALTERGLSYLESAIFPELDEANARLSDVEVFTVPAAQLADHLLETLRWYERAWTLHWLRPTDDPRERFTKLYAALTGDTQREAAAALFSYEPNLMTGALDGVLDLARIVLAHPPLRDLLLSQDSIQAVSALDAIGRVEGGSAFRQALDSLLERQGLRCGEGAGNERDEMAPCWREDPTLVLTLVRHYLTQDLDALTAARAANLARRDARVEAIRSEIADAEQRIQFDFWLTAARRALKAFEDHNYKIDSAAAALLRLAAVAAGRRLADAGHLASAEDVWWLHAGEIALALRGVESDPEQVTSEDAGQPDHWQQLVIARTAIHEWQRQLVAPETIGAPAPLSSPAPEQRPTSDATPVEKKEPPPGALVTGQMGSPGTATGRVRIIERTTVIPDLERGDVLVARNASPLWAPVFPAAAAVILDSGGFFQHAMLICREYGVPAILQAKDATQRLQEGQRVTVDGTNGWVLPASQD